jgi:TRAP-type C4-dicarboxylate transport system permease small subunit
VTQLDEAGNKVLDPAGNPITVPTLQCLEVVFEKVLNIAVELAVVVLFIFLVIGGFKFITSGGDPKATESAKNTLTYAILGLVLLIGIWLILNFIEYFTGIEVTVFKIGI